MLDAIFEEFELYRHKVANDDSASSSEDDDEWYKSDGIEK